MTLEEDLDEALRKRKEAGTLRSLSIAGTGSIDFCSNDYLGFSRDVELNDRLMKRLNEEHEQSKLSNKHAIGSTGSRLLSGNNELYEATEKKLKEFHNGKAALLFNSGYDLNLGFFASIPQEEDVLILDEFVHNSIREGSKLCRAKQIVYFNHNDITHLNEILADIRSTESKKGNILIGVESIYSMDGDDCPLKDILELCDRYDANLAVDEAHGLGVFGSQGKGLLNSLGLENHEKIIGRVYTFGKALGCHGAVCICSETVRSYLINYCRPLIFTTAMSNHSLLAINVGYDHLKNVALERQEHLQFLVNIFRNEISRYSHVKILNSRSAIQGVLVNGNHEVNELSQELQKSKFNILPIRSPTVRKGQERIRIILHSFNNETEVISFVKRIGDFLEGKR